VGKPHAALDVAGVGNGITKHSTWARKGKLEKDKLVAVVTYTVKIYFAYGK